MAISILYVHICFWYLDLGADVALRDLGLCLRAIMERENYLRGSILLTCSFDGGKRWNTYNPHERVCVTYELLAEKTWHGWDSDPGTSVHSAALWGGLLGRVVRSWDEVCVVDWLIQCRCRKVKTGQWTRFDQMFYGCWCCCGWERHSGQDGSIKRRSTSLVSINISLFPDLDTKSDEMQFWCYLLSCFSQYLLKLLSK